MAFRRSRRGRSFRRFGRSRRAPIRRRSMGRGRRRVFIVGQRF